MTTAPLYLELARGTQITTPRGLPGTIISRIGDWAVPHDRHWYAVQIARCHYSVAYHITDLTVRLPPPPAP